MAIFSFSVKLVRRLKGESAVKIAAYQSRGMLYDERESRQYDFTHKKDLLHSEIMLPAEAPAEFQNRQVLWTSAERAEKRYDARTARAVIAALQNELPMDVQIEMVRKFVNKTFVDLGMCVDIAIHDGKCKQQHHMHDQAGTQPDNPHLHLLLTDRPVCMGGFCPIKNRDWNRKSLVPQWRKSWEVAINCEFERRGMSERVSCESLEVQKAEREPKKHLGRSVAALEERGIRTRLGDINRAIDLRNQERNELENKLQLEQDRESDRGRSR